MKYREEDIDFTKLSHTLFEELCFDLVSRSGFESVTWRQGGADSGRDIEAKYHVSGSLVDPFYEKWFFECKNWKGGLPEQQVSTKLDWAEAEKADHLVLFVASYLTKDCRIYLDKRRARLSFNVHLIERKALREKILRYPELVERYFAKRAQRILRNSYLDWLAADVAPGAGQLRILLEELRPDGMTTTELFFVVVSIGVSESGLECITASCSDPATKGLHRIYHFLLENAAELSSKCESEVLIKTSTSGAIRAARFASDDVHLDTCARPVRVDRSGTTYIGSDVWLRIDSGDWIRTILAHDENRDEVIKFVECADSSELTETFSHLPVKYFAEDVDIPRKGGSATKVLSLGIGEPGPANKSLQSDPR